MIKRLPPIKPLVSVIGPSIAYVVLTRGLYALIDSEDSGLVGKANWSAKRKPNSKSFYVYRNIRIDGKRKSQMLHQLILGIIPGSKETGDHINLRTLDCRRCNLRRANRQQQVSNQGLSSRNKTGFKGVQQARGKFIANIRDSSGKVQYLGAFTFPEQAANAYDAAAIALHGEFARTNKMIQEGL